MNSETSQRMGKQSPGLTSMNYGDIRTNFYSTIYENQKLLKNFINGCSHSYHNCLGHGREDHRSHQHRQSHYRWSDQKHYVCVKTRNKLDAKVASLNYYTKRKAQTNNQTRRSANKLRKCLVKERYIQLSINCAKEQKLDESDDSVYQLSPLMASCSIDDLPGFFSQSGEAKALKPAEVFPTYQYKITEEDISECDYDFGDKNSLFSLDSELAGSCTSCETNDKQDSILKNSSGPSLTFDSTIDLLKKDLMMGDGNVSFEKSNRQNSVNSFGSIDSDPSSGKKKKVRFKKLVKINIYDKEHEITSCKGSRIWENSSNSEQDTWENFDLLK